MDKYQKYLVRMEGAARTSPMSRSDGYGTGYESDVSAMTEGRDQSQASGTEAKVCEAVCLPRFFTFFRTLTGTLHLTLWPGVPHSAYSMAPPCQERLPIRLLAVGQAVVGKV